MPEATTAAFSAGDATVQTVDNLPADRPPTEAERAYLIERAGETAAAVKKIKARVKALERVAKGDDDAAEAAAGQLPGLRESLTAAEAEAATAKEARRDA